jgi:hypothetical protein
MTRIRAATALLAGLSILVLLAGNAFAGKAAFSGNYKGLATEKVNGSKVTAVVKGSGTTTLGKSSLTGTVVATTSSESPCAPFGGPGVLTVKGGTIKVTATSSRGCAADADAQDSITVAGQLKVAGGTGKYKKAKGTLRFSGHYNRGNGAFNVKVTGPLTF